MPLRMGESDDVDELSQESHPIVILDTYEDMNTDISFAYTTSLAESSHTTPIVQLSTRVQSALTNSGSLQIIGPLEPDKVSTAIHEQRCFVLLDRERSVLGCAMVRDIARDILETVDLDMYPRPWKYVYSVMLEPVMQGRGVGREFFGDVVEFLKKAGNGGTVVLDCWAGNEKLRRFYERCGCEYVATVPEEDWEVAVFVKPLRHG